MPRWPLPELAPTSNENPMNPKLKLLLLMVPLWLSACGDADKPAMPAPQAEVGRAQEHEGEHEETNGHIALTPEQIKTSGIELALAGPAQIHETLPLYGTIMPNAERTREVAARFPGAVRSAPQPSRSE